MRPVAGSAGPSPSPRDSDARERILDSARKLFASRGYRGTPTKDIAVGAGVAAGTVFYYFPTKKDLLEAVATERLFSPSITGVITLEGGNVRSALQALAREWVGHLEDRAEVLSILVNARLDTPDVFAVAQRALVEGLDEIATYLTNETGIDHRQGLIAAHGLLSSILVGALIIPGIMIDGDDWIERTVDQVLSGLGLAVS